MTTPHEPTEPARPPAAPPPEPPAAEPAPPRLASPPPGPPPPGPPPPPGGRLWRAGRPERLLLFAGLCFAGNFLGQILMFAVTKDLFVTVGLAGVLAVIWPCWRLARAAGGTLATEFGLGRLRPSLTVWTLLATAGSFVPTSWLADLSARVRPVPEDWLAFYGEHLPDSGAEKALAYLAVVVAAPIAEELLFRGLLLRLAARAWGAWPAIVVTALAFGLLHLEPWYLFGLVGLGLLLGWLYAATGSLTTCVLAHALHNAVSLTMLLRLDGTLEQPTPGGELAWQLPLSLALLLVSLVRLRRLARSA